MPSFNPSLKPLLAVLTLASASLMTTGCVDLDDDDDSSDTARTFTAETENYQFEYLSHGEIVGGVNTYSLQVTAKDGSDLQGQTVSSVPVMDMVSGMEHSTPAASTGGELDAEGKFSSTAYFLMPTVNPQTNEKQGDWNLDVEFDGETASIPLDISWKEGARGNLFGGSDDQIKGMDGSDIDRNYYIYFEGKHHMGDMHMFSVYIAARETMMDYKPVMEGTNLSKGSAMDMSGMSMNNMMSMNDDSMLMVDSVNVEICLEDCDTNTNFHTAEASETKDGVYTISVMEQPATLEMIQVTLNINGSDKTNANGTSNIAMVMLAGDSDMSDSDHSHN